MVQAWIDGELWHGQAQNVVNLAFQVKFDLEGQGQSPPKTIGTLTKLFCTFWPNLVVLAWWFMARTSSGLTDTHTDRHTHRQTQATTIPEGQNWPWVKNQQTVAINWSVLKAVKMHQRAKFQAISPMRSLGNARKPLRTDGRTDERTDGHAVKRSRLVGWTDPCTGQKRVLQASDRRTDGWTTRKHLCLRLKAAA